MDARRGTGTPKYNWRQWLDGLFRLIGFSTVPCVMRQGRSLSAALALPLHMGPDKQILAHNVPKVGFNNPVKFIGGAQLVMLGVLANIADVLRRGAAGPAYVESRQRDSPNPKLRVS